VCSPPTDLARGFARLKLGSHIPTAAFSVGLGLIHLAALS
jgi:hypothetical protein